MAFFPPRQRSVENMDIGSPIGGTGYTLVENNLGLKIPTLALVIIGANWL